ncbi:hypothetical protein C5167_013844 [Papaver somniferum]|uniref:Uncharacterized protein n=1 Tax=Papaver somniferum TaxID=3469 RepID=A0A4Y7J4K9_PAPSO|nr:hypothetical protein C5167_013844 [Papaver somniferum]
MWPEIAQKSISGELTQQKPANPHGIPSSSFCTIPGLTVLRFVCHMCTLGTISEFNRPYSSAQNYSGGIGELDFSHSQPYSFNPAVKWMLNGLDSQADI